MKSHKYLVLLGLAWLCSCTNLDEHLNQDLTKSEAEAYLNAHTDVNAILKSAYDGLRLPFLDQAQFWAAQEHTSDEVLGPTRGPDWDDNGVWRVLHSHQWTADHAFLSASFNSLLQEVFTSSNILNFNTTPQQAAEARFLRDFSMFAVADGWNQVPYRAPGENLLNAPQVLKGSAALDFVISDLTAILNDLPAAPPVNKANQDAAKVLLMKAYLNKGTFANRQSPTFDAGDMNQVISLADAIINSGKYSLDGNYFENFAPNNDANSSENIWTLATAAGVNPGPNTGNGVRSRWFCTLHYNQNPSGWNGFTTLSDFYDSFESGDVRKGGSYPGVTDVSGLKVGFLIGQQYDQNGVALKDRKGNDLSFTPEINPVETGNNLEVTGIRVVKYPPDFANGDFKDNDYVFFRYADVLLMKAEALLRTGNASGALDIVNNLRTVRNASQLGSLDLDGLLAERGRELYWEGWRRQDMIRFGHFLDARQGKAVSGPERLLFPIPAAALSVNPNLEQNPGY
ncbi:MAG: RagB/SusD family nutrient uptake outer membrane protein [Saprospiraceae bacterium]|uniref:RagB/SusD family nutrient uptake outer membrane protein n=1 Tax=Candidatus Opimibacter skivensis TaxID=2982028 RepID=A0A9D7XUK7_9BACT|nr:RagB/SusD family nutrient uptake outer membrane protein [Candidatus Opimibacter skivensis]